MTRRLAAGMLALVLFAGPAWAGQEGASGVEPLSIERYRVISERNIFLRDRSRIETPVRTASGPPTARGEPMPILRGVMGHSGTFAAFLEDPRSGVTTPVRVGQSVAGGRVAHIGADHILFERGGQTRRIELGWSLAGAAAGAAATSASSTSAPSAPGGPSSDLLERMRLRREQELRPPAPPSPPSEETEEQAPGGAAGPPAGPPSEEPTNAPTRTTE